MSQLEFNETWLTESPEGIGKTELYDMFIYNIADLKRNGQISIDMGNGYRKIELSTCVYYWYEIDNEIILGSELEKKPQGLVVRITGKNSNWRGRKPYASSLYDVILKDCGKGVRILSDVSLSDEGYAIWKRLFKMGHKISIYDALNPGRTFKTFLTINDFDNYFENDNTDYKRYQYILTETKILAETRNFFNTQRYRELAGV
jgi:hypothetical protein